MITTKIQDKNKNNFKLISENFKNWASLNERIEKIFINESDDRLWELATDDNNDFSSSLLEQIYVRKNDLYWKNLHLLSASQLETILEFIMNEQADSATRLANAIQSLLGHAKAGGPEGKMATKVLERILSSGTYKGQTVPATQMNTIRNSMPAIRSAATAAASAATSGGGGAGSAGAQGARTAAQGGGQLATQGGRELATQTAKQGAKQAAARGGQLALTNAAPQVAARTGLSQTVARQGLKQLALQGGKQIAARGALALLGPIGWGITAISIGYSLYQLTKDGDEKPEEAIKKIPKPSQAELQKLAREFSKNMSPMQRDVLNRNAMIRAANSLNMMEEDIALAIMNNPGKTRSLLKKLEKDTANMGENGYKEFLEIVDFLNPASMPGQESKPNVPGGGGKKKKASAGPNTFIGRKAKRQEELIRRLNQGISGLKEQATDDSESEKEKAVPGTEEQSVTLASLQQSLIDMGYDLGKYGADGVYGSRTYRAIVKFQKDNGLQRDGLIGPNTFARMREKDKGIMSKSSTMGLNVPKKIEKTVDKIAKTPRDKKAEAYARAATSSPEDLKKLKDTAREVRRDARKKAKEAEEKGDMAERNRQAIRHNKAGALIRSVQQGEQAARVLKGKEESREFAKRGGIIFLSDLEKPKNLELWNSFKPYAMKKWFIDTWCGGKSSQTQVLRWIHLLRTGYWNIKPKGEKFKYGKLDFLQKEIQKSVDEYRAKNAKKEK